MTLQLLEQISIIATAITALGGLIYITLTRFKKPVKKNKTTPEDVLKYIEELNKKIDTFKKEIRKEFSDEKKHAYNTHLRIFDKLEELSDGLSFIKGFLKTS